MIATPLSQRPYFPALLANGADAVLLNYSGSMVSGLTGHAHFEQHQGCPCAWYKVGHGSRDKGCGMVQPIVQSGYQILLDGEVCDIDDYEQRFDPITAMLHTRASARGVIVRIEAFLTGDPVLVERYRVERVPAGKRADLAFFVRTTDGRTGGLTTVQTAALRVRGRQGDAVSFDYSVGPIRGAGRLLSDRPADEPYGALPGLLFHGVRRGFRAAKFLVLADGTDERGFRGRVERAAGRCRELGAAGLAREHRLGWSRYARGSRVTLPDEEFQYLYDNSLYVLRANQHPRTGAISVGPLPSLWGGGVHDPFDGAYAHRALLATNRLEEARRHLGYYDLQRRRGRKLARDAGLPGAMYSGWSDCFGNDLTRDLGAYLLDYKPLMPAYIVLDRYWQWVYDPADRDHAQRLPLMREILDLAVARFVLVRGQKAFMAPCTAGNESYVQVENDTMNGLAYARAMAGYGEMAQALGQRSGALYAELARKLYRGLDENYRAGVLMPYRGAKYLTGLQLDFYLTNLPEGIDPRSVWAALGAMRTRWGLDSDQPSEAYRDWPWCSSWAAIALAHMGCGSDSFRWLRHPMGTMTALGVLPEKVRLDGYAIGYGYPSPHALLAWATAHALCHTGPNGELRLLAGLDGQWRDLAFERLRVDGGLLASGTVQGGRLERLQLRNTSGVPLRRRVSLNRCYHGPRERDVLIPARRTVDFCSAGA